MTYTFVPDDYRIAVAGRVTGVGPNGGTLLVGMGPTLANTEANIEENHRALAVVTRHNDAERTDLSGLKAGETRTVSGPLDWVAIKSKYFVTGILAYDSTGGRIGGAAIRARPTTEKRATEADVQLSLPLPPGGEFSYTAYAGTHGGRSPRPSRPRVRRRQPVRLARVPHHHPAGGRRGALAAGLDAPAPAPGLRPGPDLLRHRGAGAAVAAQSEGHAGQHAAPGRRSR